MAVSIALQGLELAKIIETEMADGGALRHQGQTPLPEWERCLFKQNRPSHAQATARGLGSFWSSCAILSFRNFGPDASSREHLQLK